MSAVYEDHFLFIYNSHWKGRLGDHHGFKKTKWPAGLENDAPWEVCEILIYNNGVTFIGQIDQSMFYMSKLI